MKQTRGVVEGNVKIKKKLWPQIGEGDGTSEGLRKKKVGWGERGDEGVRNWGNIFLATIKEKGSGP